MRLFHCFLPLLILGICSCQGNKPTEGSASSGEWQQLDDFHFVMAESFHPFADSGNLAPARRYAGEMATRAKEWANEPLPEKVDNDEMLSLLARLRDETAEFESVASAESDSVAGRKLESIHNVFHEIQELWYTTGSDHDAH